MQNLNQYSVFDSSPQHDATNQSPPIIQFEAWHGMADYYSCTFIRSSSASHITFLLIMREPFQSIHLSIHLSTAD